MTAKTKKRAKRDTPAPELGRGAPTLLEDPEVREGLLEVIRAGALPDVASRFMGLPESMVMEWLRRGAEVMQREAKGQPLSERDHMYLGFAREVAQTYAKLEVEYTGLLLKMARGGDLKAVQFYLTHAPGVKDRWGERTETVHSGEVEYQVKFSDRPIEEATQALEAVGKSR